MADPRSFQALISLLEARGFRNGKDNVRTVDLTTVGNVGAGEDDLITFNLPADTLDANLKGVRITAWGKKADNANAKTVNIYFGSTMLSVALTASELGEWRAVAEVFRTGVGAQKFHAIIQDAPTVTTGDQADGTLAEDETAAIIIKVTGTATADDDIEQEGLLVELLG